MADITLVGNLGDDPELRVTVNGKMMARCSVAENRRRGDEYVTQWWAVVAFDDLAETFAESAKKGDRVIVVGSIQRQQVEEREYISVVAREIGLSCKRQRVEAYRVSRQGADAA